MSGILNSKERVMDFIITQEGKRQAGAGNLRVSFASFTDQHTFYETSGSLSIPALASDASDRIFFEAYSRYQDTIIPELEDGTSLRPFKTSDFHVAGNLISEGTFQVGFVNRLQTEVTGGIDLPSTMSNMLGGIECNFTDQRIIGSIDEYSLSNNFVISPKSKQFIEKDTGFFKASTENSAEIHLENISSIFNDRRFSQFPNFLFLPPENMPFPGQATGSVLANYPKLDEDVHNSFNDVFSSLQGSQFETFEFKETSRTNSFFCQVFESKNAGNSLAIDKLSIIDFGNFDDETPGSPESLDSPGRRVFFAGKIRKDATGAETFVCLFTIIID